MKLPIAKIKVNPDNPRIIKDDNFKNLVQSIKDFPEMADIRPVVINKNNVILGGNMRFRAMKEAGWTEIPVIQVDLPEEKEREFIIKDNVSGGEWDWDLLANEWELEDLEKWGLETINFQIPDDEQLIDQDKNKPPSIKITFENVIDLEQARIDIEQLLNDKYPNAYFSLSAGEL